MFFTIFFAFLLAKVKKHNIKPAFKEISLYPVFIIELLSIIAQVSLAFGNTFFVQYAGAMKLGFMLVLLYPFFKFKLYPEGGIGAICVFIGTVLNEVVIRLNGGKMPVFPTLSYLTGYVNENSFNIKEDTLHILGSSATKCNFLSDIIDVGYSILSIGDIFIRVYIFLIIYGTIKSASNNWRLKDANNNS